MLRVEVDTDELNKLIDELSRQGDNVRAWVADEVTYTALAIESQAKADCPVVTGRLRSSIRALVDREGDSVSAIVGTNVEYAAIVEFGSQALKRRAKPYLYPAYIEEVGKLTKRLKDALGRNR